MTGRITPPPTNVPARNLADPRYRPKVVRPRKGKGAYTRKGGSKSTPYTYQRAA